MNPNVMWTSTLEGKYALTITRIDDYLGELTRRTVAWFCTGAHNPLGNGFIVKLTARRPYDFCSADPHNGGLGAASYIQKG